MSTARRNWNRSLARNLLSG